MKPVATTFYCPCPPATTLFVTTFRRSRSGVPVAGRSVARPGMLGWCVLLTTLLIATWPDVARAQPIGSGTVRGVDVLAKGSSTGTTPNGPYQLGAPPDATLVFSFVGPQTQEVRGAGRSTVDVRLTDNVRQLADVCITATSRPVRRLGTTTAVESIGFRDIERTTILLDYTF